MKHAWLIIAHNEFGILQLLVSSLDSVNCDFYIHIDRKVKQLPEIKAEFSKIIFITERLDVRWGSFSQIQCELLLFESSFTNGPYDYYHIISGTTLPLKSLNQIDDYFETKKGSNIFDRVRKEQPYQEKLKVHRYNCFLRNYSFGPVIVRKVSQFLWKSLIAIQRVCHIETNRGKDLYKASNWVSLTHEAVQYLISNEYWIEKTFRYSFCGDEYFVPSTLMNSYLKETILSDGHYLFHDISRSNAAVYMLSDLTKLSESGCLFARKFTER